MQSRIRPTHPTPFRASVSGSDGSWGMRLTLSVRRQSGRWQNGLSMPEHEQQQREGCAGHHSLHHGRDGAESDARAILSTASSRRFLKVVAALLSAICSSNLSLSNEKKPSADDICFRARSFISSSRCARKFSWKRLMPALCRRQLHGLGRLALCPIRDTAWTGNCRHL